MPSWYLHQGRLKPFLICWVKSKYGSAASGLPAYWQPIWLKTKLEFRVGLEGWTLGGQNPLRGTHSCKQWAGRRELQQLWRCSSEHPECSLFLAETRVILEETCLLMQSSYSNGSVETCDMNRTTRLWKEGRQTCIIWRKFDGVLRNFLLTWVPPQLLSMCSFTLVEWLHSIIYQKSALNFRIFLKRLL